MNSTVKPILDSVRSRIRQIGRPLFQTAARSLTHSWPPHSRLFLLGDTASWVLDWEMRELARIARQLGVRTPHPRWLGYAEAQAIFYSSQFVLLENQYLDRPHRIGLTYFHGYPGTNILDFDRLYERLGQVHPRIDRVQVSHSKMRDIVLSSGIAPEKVFLIPIGINLSYFHPQTAASRQKARSKYNIPDTAAVIGSFQKDGVGWDEGSQPKLIKGPDIFLKTIALLKPRIPELYVLLSGPARGYIKQGLEKLDVPYKHYWLKDYREIGQLFQALDLYIVASRQEGGPKAILESMASGVPLVTTRVGQAMDLVRHGQNGWLAEVEDTEALAYWADYVLTHQNHLQGILRQGYQTAQAHTYEAQIPLWRDLMNGFVNLSGS